MDLTRVQRDTLIYIFISLTSVLLLVWAIPLYTPPYPGYGASPALVPNVSVGVMLVMAILALGHNVLGRRGSRFMNPEESEYPVQGMSATSFSQVGKIKIWHLVRYMLPCVLLIPGFNTIGFIPTSFAFMLLIQYLVGSRSLIRPLVIAIVAVAVMYGVMRYGFGVPIPGT